MNIETFFAEKNLENRTYKIEVDGMMHWIETEVVIEAIKNSPKSERRQIADVLRRIDIVNGDVHHFLNHLAGALAQKWAA